MKNTWFKSFNNYSDIKYSAKLQTLDCQTLPASQPTKAVALWVIPENFELAL